MKYDCPVCGYDELEEPAEYFSICPSCGTEFENDDEQFSHDELRQNWIASGAKWWNPYVTPPLNWSPISQLRNVPYQVTEDDLKVILDREITSGKLFIGIANAISELNTPVAHTQMANIHISSVFTGNVVFTNQPGVPIK